jgi:hypothetical protein
VSFVHIVLRKEASGGGMVLQRGQFFSFEFTHAPSDHVVFSNCLWYDEGIMLEFQRHRKGREEQKIWGKNVNGILIHKLHTHDV